MSALCSAGSLHAQEFPPRKGASIMVGFAAGGAADTAARIIARRLTDNLGVAVAVDNKPGAGGKIGRAHV